MHFCYLLYIQLQRIHFFEKVVRNFVNENFLFHSLKPLLLNYIIHIILVKQSSLRTKINNVEENFFKVVTFISHYSFSC